MDNSISSIIDSARSVLILLPVKPNFDTVSAGLSFYLSLMDKKQATISCPSPMMVGFNRIIGADRITSVLGNKNLTIKFKNYDAASIEKVSYDIINSEFNLTVVPKVGFTSPTKDQIDTSYAGVSADLVVLIGGASDSDFPSLASEKFATAKIVHIGNRSISSTRDILSFAKPGAAISELIANVIKEDTNLEMDPDIATNLVMGVEEGSGNFADSEVTPDTFETFAYLLRNGGRRQSRIKLSPANFPPGAIPTQPFGQKVSKVSQVPQVLQVPQTQNATQVTEALVSDPDNTQETEQDINPPDDWLQPKVFKGSATTQVSQPSNPDSFSENKG